MIFSEEQFDTPKIFDQIMFKEADSLVNTQIFGNVVATYPQTITVDLINTTDPRTQVYCPVLALTTFLGIPDINSINDSYSNFMAVAARVLGGGGSPEELQLIAQSIIDSFPDEVGVGINILEVLALAAKYLGAYIVPPTQHDDGTPLEDGDMIYDRHFKVLKVYDLANTQWVVVTFSPPTEYFVTGIPVTRVDDTTFTVPADHTNLYSAPKRLRFSASDTSEVTYATITSSTYDSGTDLTTIIVSNDGPVIPSTVDAADISTIPSNKWMIINNPLSGLGNSLNTVAAGTYNNNVHWLVGGFGGKLLRSVNFGATWIELTSPTTEHIEKIEYLAFSQTFFFRTASSLYRSIDGGDTWAEITANVVSWDTTNPKALKAHPTENYIYISNSADIRYSQNNGDSWNIGATTYNYKMDLLEICNGNGLVSASIEYSGTNSEMAVTTNTSYENIFTNSRYTKPLIDVKLWDLVSFVDGSNNIVTIFVGDNGFGYRHIDTINSTTDAAITSLDANIDLGFGSTSIRGITRNPITGTIVAVGDLGKIAYSIDDGVTWQQTGNSFSVNDTVHDIAYNDENNLFVTVGEDGKIAVSNNGID